ncbi:MAG: dihydrodipicolinate synthase family protein [Verrucomicrobia bacterium]|nr:dihydrodipicolinate synthase family protein [Verrucomicrobiota bacterium]
MRTIQETVETTEGVFAVPPLCRRRDTKRSIDFGENDRLVRHIARGGIKRLMYGGNAFLHHITLQEYESLLEWLDGLPVDLWVIPSLGPTFGRSMDQARVLRKYRFSCFMALPCADPRDAAGLEQGLREVADAAEKRLVIYLKAEDNFGSDKGAGLDAVARLVDSGLCAAIKYAIVREDPTQDHYLEELLARVDRTKVISGMGERPAVSHLRDWQLPGFTTGSGCIAPRLSEGLFEAAKAGNLGAAEELRLQFLPLEDLRDAWGPARVLHHATELAEVANTGSPIPFLSPLSEAQLKLLAPVAKELAAKETRG